MKRRHGFVAMHSVKQGIGKPHHWQEPHSDFPRILESCQSLRLMAAAKLPLELFYEIALHLPSTSDVLTFTLTHSRVREVLSMPGFFKDRLALQGWDVSAWLGEDSSNAAVSRSPQGNLERWMHIDYIYCRTVQLFDEAAADNYFSESPPDSDVGSDCDVREPELLPEPEQLDQGLFNDIVTPQFSIQRPVPRNHSLDRQKTIGWLRKLSEVLPVFLTHHRGENVSRITEARHRGALSTYATVLTSICGSVIPNDILSSVSGSQVSNPMLSTSEYAWLERSCFCFAALLIQCDTNTVRSTFCNPEVYTDSPFPVFRSFWEADYVHSYPADLDPYSHPIAIAKIRQLRISEHYFSTFLIQAMISMMLHSDPSLPLRAPLLPYINPAASFSYDEPYGLQHEYTTRHVSLYPLPPPRPWLRNRLAGTPLAELSSSADSEGDANDGGCRRHMWAGYYTEGDETAGPPMFLELYSVKGPIGRLPLPGLEPDPLERIDFRGEGHDGVGAFTLSGFCNIRTGVVMATKAYTTHEWKWRGMVTPFGMAGIWGLGPYTGWWWIWPREWSDYPATTGSD